MTSDPISQDESQRLIRYINLKLALIGCPVYGKVKDPEYLDFSSALVAHQRESDRLLANYYCPADHRIQNFIYDYLQESALTKLPVRTFVLDRAGLARALSLAPDQDKYVSDIVTSYRVKQGVLHNPKSDRRTTQGTFHVAEGGLPIPDDKVAVPRDVFARILNLAFTPPRELLRLPFTSSQEDQAECFVSLLLRPLVCPEVPGVLKEKSMEIRFFVPGNLVSNLDFVETIFGNAGDPFLPQFDSALDVEHWTGHTGCVILAPHLIFATKKSLGLPHYEQATERQRRDKMCYRAENEMYNDGNAFKLTARDESGVILTIIADNYFGYCKKEVKTQISFSANLFGLCEEEHAGGALVYPSYDLGEEFSGYLHVKPTDHSFEEVREMYGELMILHPDGYGVDKKYTDIFYVPEKSHFDLHKCSVSWEVHGKTRTIKLLPGHTYIRPSGYKVHMDKPGGGRAWRLVGTVAEGALCHKPCTVSGGGKSEISKPITDAILQGPVFVADFKNDFDIVEQLIDRDYSARFKDSSKSDHRPIISAERSLGSVIKLLTPASRDYTQEYNDWLNSVPQYIKELVFVVKRFYKPEWAEKWREHFSVDIVNGKSGNELKCDNRKLVSNYLRVGFEADGSWRTFGLRKDFYPAIKIQMEDDITASVVVPFIQPAADAPKGAKTSLKFVQNCEYKLFQRPDDAIHRGYDKQTELEFTKPGTFFSNYEPLTSSMARDILEDSVGFYSFTEPMQKLIREIAETGHPSYFISSAHPRIVDGKPSKNPRYLQDRRDLVHPRETYLANVATRLKRRIPLGKPVYTPVDAVVPGRRNNPPQDKIRPLAVFNPIHYMELPELFMEFICSMTGKSPSTTGAGSEGALTKGPFNALSPIIDLNNSLVSFILTGHSAFVTAAGHVGPDFRVDHDVSLLVPEVWCRMSEAERDPAFLIRNNYLEKCGDMEFEGRKALSSRLGYRITPRFVRTFFGRVFNHPHVVFTKEMLRPELQSAAIFVDGMDNITSTQKRVAQSYFEDGSIEAAVPPLRALLHIMAEREDAPYKLEDPEFRKLFTRESLDKSPWYKQRILAKQKHDIELWNRHILYLQQFLHRRSHADEAERLHLKNKLTTAQKTLRHVESPAYLAELDGTLGVDPYGQKKENAVANPEYVSATM